MYFILSSISIPISTSPIGVNWPSKDEWDETFKVASDEDKKELIEELVNATVPILIMKSFVSENRTQYSTHSPNPDGTSLF